MSSQKEKKKSWWYLLISGQQALISYHGLAWLPYTGVLISKTNIWRCTRSFLYQVKEHFPFPFRGRCLQQHNTAAAVWIKVIPSSSRCHIMLRETSSNLERGARANGADWKDVLTEEPGGVWAAINTTYFSECPRTINCYFSLRLDWAAQSLADMKAMKR